MAKQYREKKGCFLFTAIRGFFFFMVFAAILSMFTGNTGNVNNTSSSSGAPVQTHSDTSAQSAAATPKPTNTEKPTPSPTPATQQEWISGIVRKEYGDSFISVAMEKVDQGKMITICHKFEDNFTKSLRRDMFMFHAKDVMRQLTELLKDGTIDFDLVFIHGRTTFIDQYGQESEGDAMQLCMDAKTLKKIVWDNMRIDMMPDIAKTYAVHPTLRD